MNTTNEYAGSLFDTPHQATLAAVEDFVTAFGSIPWPDTKEECLQVADEFVELVQQGEWHIPNVPAEETTTGRVLLLMEECVDEN